MTKMKRRAALAVALVLWAAGASAATALVYDLNRPLRPAVVEREQPTEVLRPALTSAAEPGPLSMIYLKPITITALTPRPHVIPKTPRLPEISRMSCDDWRELDMGSGHVQVCK